MVTTYFVQKKKFRGNSARRNGFRELNLQMDKNEEESDEDQSPAVVCTLQDRQMVEFKNQIVV